MHHQPPLLLVVEDDPDHAMLIAHAVVDLGEVVMAGDAAAALRLYRERRPDVVLLDINLPDEDGFVVLERIRAESDVPVVMVTGRGNRADRAKGWELGVDMYMTKPFSLGELRARVAVILRRRSPRPD